MFSIKKSLRKAVTKGFPWTNQFIRKNNIIEYIEMLSSLMLELLNDEKGLYKSKSYRVHLENISGYWIEFFMWKKEE